MPAAPIPPDEAKRLEALKALALDSTPEERFDRITRLLRTAMDVPIALISIIEADRQFFKSKFGIEGTETPRAISFCAYTILSDDPLIVADARKDARFSDNPDVTDNLLVRFYAGIPLHAKGGERLGTLCAVDTKPREVTEREIETMKSLARIAEGELNNMSLTQAMTQLVKQEGEILEQRELFDLFMDNNPGLGFIKDDEGRLVHVTRKFEQIFGMSPESIKGQRTTDWMPADKAAVVTEHEREVLETNAPVQVIEVVPGPDGKVRHWDILRFPFKNRAGQRFIGGVAYDISQRVMAEKALRESESQFRNLVENSSDLIHTSNLEGRIIYANPAWLEALGYTTADVEAGLSVFEIIHPDYVAPTRARIRDLGTGKNVTRFESRFISRDGRVLDVEGNVSFSNQEGQAGQNGQNGQGENGGLMCGIYRDITARKALDAESRRARQESEKAIRAKTQFFATMSHEIRTPLNGIVGMTSMLMLSKLSEEQVRYARTIDASGRVLVGLINEILDFSKLEAKATQLEHISFPLEMLVEEVVAVISVGAREKGLKVRWYVGDEVPKRLSGDPERLRQVLTNLMGNAVKFTEKGEVRVDVRVESEPGELEDEGMLLRFTVMDTGIGMERDARERVFDAFAQADASTTRKYGGTGLGLAISRQIVRLMGGDIHVHSDAGQGSTFWFTARFGLGEAAGVTEPPEAPGMRTTERALRFLIAEDNAVNQLVLEEHLLRLGHKFVTVENGKEALEALKEGTWDAVLMDCQMPVMDGYEAVTEIRRREAESGSGHLWVIAVTANAMVGERETCLAFGMDDFLTKPFQIQELAGTIARIPGSEEQVEVQAVDDEQLSGLARSKAANGENLLTRMVRLFVESAPQTLKQMDDALADEDLVTAGRAAHKLKGGCSYFGAQHLHALCSELERAGKAGSHEEARKLVPRLRHEYERVEAGLKQAMEGMVTNPTV